jgi:ferrochelatase
MERLAAEGATAVMVDPIGFISDHVETLYDNDIGHRANADKLGIEFHRCRCLNHHPGLIETLADVVVATAK